MHRGHHRHRFAPRMFGGGLGPRPDRDFRRGHDHDHDGEGHGRGRRGRFFGQGDLRLVMLHMTAEKPRHGYEIIKAIEERVAGLYSPSPGVVYPTLTLLEELGHVAADQADGKKLYAATEEGRAFLDANRTTVDAILRRMTDIHAANQGGPPPQVLRAMENLKVALRLKLSRSAVSEDQARAIAAELDAVASRIEQM